HAPRRLLLLPLVLARRPEQRIDCRAIRRILRRRVRGRVDQHVVRRGDLAVRVRTLEVAHHRPAAQLLDLERLLGPADQPRHLVPGRRELPHDRASQVPRRSRHEHPERTVLPRALLLRPLDLEQSDHHSFSLFGDGSRGLDSRRGPGYIPAMAKNFSFDVSTGVDLQEVDNAVNQARKEVAQRYDFKGAHAEIEFDRARAVLRLEADDEYKMRALYDVLQSKLVRRGVPLKNLKPGSIDTAALGRVRQVVALQQGIPADTAKQIARAIKDRKMKNVQVAIQGDELRVSSPSKDALQEVIAFLRGQDFGVELQFGNYR